MSIDMNGASRQSEIFSQSADNINNLRSQLSKIKENMNIYWMSNEMQYINMKFDNIIKKMKEVSTELQSIGSDINGVAHEIEEEERIERERQERERQEQERLEKERQEREAREQSGISDSK